MDHQTDYRNHTDEQSNPQLRRQQQTAFSLEYFEARLAELDDRIKKLHTKTPLARSKSGAQVSDAALDLRVKVDAVRWMLRVAKHLNGAARERVILTIANSLGQIEKAADPVTRAA